MPHLAAGEVERRVVVLVLRGAQDETDDDVDVPRGFQEGPQPVGAQLEGDVGDLVLEEIAGEAELREDDQLGLFGGGLVDQVEVKAEVLLEVTQARRALRQRQLLPQARLRGLHG